jgi:transposase
LLITHVETTSAPISDDTTLPTIHAGLDRKALLPAEHLVDMGYVDAQLLVESQQNYQVDLVGPTRKDYRGPAKQQKGFDAGHFLIDWDQHQATCPRCTHQRQLEPHHRQPAERSDPNQVFYD